MNKMIPWVLINALALILIVYADLVVWTAYGPSSYYQQFPMIYLIVIPIMLIAFPVLWKKLPKTG